MRLVICALALSAVIAPPVSAAEPVVGFGCGFTVTNDPSGVVEPDPNRFYGEMDGGPVVVPVDPADPVLNTTVTCSIQINALDPAAPDAASASATTSGNVGYLPPTAFTLRSEPGDNLALCTRVTWQARSGTHTFDFDSVDGLDGVQCALAVSPG